MAGRRLSTTSFISDPIYRKLVMGAATKVPSATSVSLPILGGDDGSPPSFTGDTGPGGIPDYFGLSTNVESTLPTTTTEPTFGVVNEYDFTNRVGQAIGQNTPYIIGSLQMGSLDPLKLGAIDAGIESLFGNVPDYITRESSPGVMSQTGGFESTKSYGLFPDGRIAEVTAEDLANPEIRSLTAAEADRYNPIGYVGADPRTPAGAALMGVQTIAMSMVPFLNTIPGPIARTPAGQPMALGSSFLGKMQHDEMWRADSLVKAGTPGVFTMTFGKNGFASYRATQDSIFGFDIEGGRVTRLTGDQFKRLYGATRGYDYRKVDWANSVANSGELIGPKLIGHVQGVGGFTKEGEFIDQRGTIYNNLNARQLDTYTRTIQDPVAMAQVAGVLSAKAAASSGYRKNLLQRKATRLAELAGGAAEREYQQGLAMRTPEEIAYDSWSGASEDGGLQVGTSIVGGKEYTTISSSNGDNNGITRSVSGDTRVDSRGNTTNFNVDRSNEVYFAEGGRVGKAEGEMVGPESMDAQGPVGFVNGRTPEQVSEADTVADDVEGSVPEGTFVINAVAVERFGSMKLKKLLLNALQEAERQGIDISQSENTMRDEESVSVALSEGEVVVPPFLVRIIGLERLEKINSVGQEEVTERVEEYGQADTSEPVEGEAPVEASLGGSFVERQRKAPGGEISDKEWDTLVGRANRMFENPGRNARKTEKFPKEFLDALDRILKQQKGIMSETDVGGGSTVTQREISSSTPLTPERAQELYINFPTIRQIILAEKGRGDTQQRIQALDAAEQMLRQQIGDNVPQQNAAVSVDDVYGDTFLSFEEALDGPENNARVVSETDVERQGRRQERNRRFGERKSRRSDGGFIERQKKAPGGLVQPLKIVTGKSGVIEDPEYLDKTFENAFKNMMRNRRAVEENVQQKIRMNEPVPPLEDLQKQLREIHQQYQSDMKEIKKVSDPYVFQEYMRTHTNATADYYNSIEGFGEDREKTLLVTDDYLADLATMRVSIPIGSQDDAFIPTGRHYGITFKESAAGGKARGYTHGVKSNSTSPASTGFHEAGHVSLRDKEGANPLYKGIDGAFVYRRKDQDGKIIEGVRLTEEEMMRVHDMYRGLSLNNKDAYERARNFIVRNPESNFGNYLEGKNEKETESVVYDIVYGALTNDYFGEHEVKQSFAKQRLPRPK